MIDITERLVVLNDGWTIGNRYNSIDVKTNWIEIYLINH